MLRGGGVAFGPKPRDFSTKLPRKVIEMGMRVALSAKLRNHGLGVVESLDWPGMKTRPLAKRVAELKWRKTLFVTGLDVVPEGLQRASGNIEKVHAITARDLVVYDAVKWPRLVLDLAAVDWFERTLGKNRALIDVY
jgi:large subunit ribosomal protein L4